MDEQATLLNTMIEKVTNQALDKINNKENEIELLKKEIENLKAESKDKNQTIKELEKQLLTTKVSPIDQTKIMEAIIKKYKKG